MLAAELLGRLNTRAAIDRLIEATRSADPYRGHRPVRLGPGGGHQRGGAHRLRTRGTLHRRQGRERDAIVHPAVALVALAAQRAWILLV